MKVNKRLLSITALSLSAALLTACGSGTPGVTAEEDQTDATEGAEAPEGADETSGETIQVEFWHHVFTTPENDWYEQVVEDFNNSQDEIFINATVVPGDAWDQKMKAAQAAGNAPDLYPAPGRLNDGVRLGSYMELDDLLPQEAFDAVTDAAKEISQVNDTWYAYPLLLEPQRVLYWDKEIFEEAGLDPEVPPTSWDELYDFCAKIKPVLASGQFCIETGGNEGDLAWTTVAEQMHVAGHMPLTDDWTEPDLEGFEELIEYYRTLYENGYMPQQPLGAGNSAAAFGEGKSAMLAQGSWGMSELAADYPDMVERVGVAPHVTSDGNQQESVSTVGNFKWVIDAKSQHPEAAAKFIEYTLAGDAEVLEPFFVNTKFTKAPARQDVADLVNSHPEAADAPWGEIVTEQVVPYTISEPLHPWDVNLAVGLAIQKGMMGESSPEDALAEAAETISTIIEREDLPQNRVELGN